VTESEVDLAFLRAGTRAFIAADPRDVVLTRTPLVPTGTGGLRRGTPVLLPAQRLRVLPADAGPGTERRLPDGTVVVPTWVLLGEHTADIGRGDTFPLSDGSTGEVVYVHEKKSYQVKGEVVSRGAA
jgi:hypothetical protein